jgi:hypothetical protein
MKTPSWPRWIRVLAGFQFLGGICCIAGSVMPIGQSGDTIQLHVEFVPLLAGAASALAGFLLVVRDRLGLTLSFLVQTAQVISFSGSFRYVFFAGPLVRFIVHGNGSAIAVGAGGVGFLTGYPPDATFNAVGLAFQFMAGIGTQPDAGWAFGVNLVALYFAIRLARGLRPSLVSEIPAGNPQWPESEVGRSSGEKPASDAPRAIGSLGDLAPPQGVAVIIVILKDGVKRGMGHVLVDELRGRGCPVGGYGFVDTARADVIVKLLLLPSAREKDFEEAFDWLQKHPSVKGISVPQNPFISSG